MTSKPDRRPRLVALLLVASLVTGFAATVSVSAAPDLGACKVADTLTRYRTYGTWHRSLLDMTYRLSSTYKPTDLRSTSYAGLNGGFSVRLHVIADLKAMAAAARRAGARLSVQSAFRSYATQKSTFAYWVRVHGYAVALKESARAGHSEHQLGTALDFRSYGGSAPWNYTDWATTKAGSWLKANAWKYGFIMSYPKGKTSRHVLHLRAVALPLCRPHARGEDPRQRADPAGIPVARAEPGRAHARPDADPDPDSHARADAQLRRLRRPRHAPTAREPTPTPA